MEVKDDCIRTHHIAVAVGTRPEIIKMAPVIRALRSYPNIKLLLVNTAQHYDHAMSGQFLEAIGQADIELNAGGRSRADCIGVIVSDLGATLHHYRPDALLVHGDTNTTLASALAANAEGVFLAHVEAGLRSYDRAMPEEHNRVLTDHLADLCFAPTANNRDNLVRESIPLDRIAVVRNTIVEAVSDQLPALARQRSILDQYRLTRDQYLLATIHRPENTDDPNRLAHIFRTFNESSIPVVIPLHPRTRSQLTGFGLWPLTSNCIIINPLDAPEFLALESNARLLISDSGGVAEESTILRRRLVIVRNSTERPEAIEAGFASLTSPDSMGDAIKHALQSPLPDAPSPYGDGTAARAIALTLVSTLNSVQKIGAYV